MRKVAALTLMIGSLALAPTAKAEEARVDVIFTGVVPPTCVVEVPSNNISSHPDGQEYTFQTDNSAQVVCNDEAQVNTGEFTSATQLDSPSEPATLQTDSQEFLTITAR